MTRVVALLVAASALLGCSSGPGVRQLAGERYRLRYASPQSPGHPFSRADQTWITHVQHASRGRIEIEPFWSGALLSADLGMLELRHGVAEIGAITPIYTRGGAHLLRAQAGFYAGARSFEDQVRVYKALAREFPAFARELAGLHVLAVQGGNLPALITRERPVRALEDLRALRLRAPAELTAVLHELGADPVSMPIGEVYSAMAKGVIDGVVAPADTLRSLHLAEVARYLTELEVPRGAYPARAISARALRALPRELQRVLLGSSVVWEEALAREIGAAHERGVRFGRERGVEWIALASDDQRRFDARYNRSARDSARTLARHGLAGEPIFERAQALIHQPRSTR